MSKRIPFIELVRDTFTTRATGGRLLVNGKPFCYTLEDAARADGVKINSETCIPEYDSYLVKVTHSPRFGRLMPIIYTEPDEITVNVRGIIFTGIRFHGGNTHADSAGCPLVAYNRLNDLTIQGTAEKDLTVFIQQYEYVRLIVRKKQWYDRY